MSILPWIQYVQTPYIKISNLRIDGETQSLRDEWREERLSNPVKIFFIKFWDFCSIWIWYIWLSKYWAWYLFKMKLFKKTIIQKAEKFYDENLDSLNVYAVTHGIETKFRISQKMKLIKEGSPLDDSPMYWKTSIKISKDYFGKSIYISPTLNQN